MEKQERKSNVTTKIKKSTLARGKWQLSPTLRQYPAELSQTWAIVRKAEGRVITSSSGLRGVPTVMEQELRAHWWQQDVTFKTGVGILAVEYSRYMYPVYGTQTYGTATLQRCKKSSQWMGEVPCLTVALLRSSHPYLSAGGATAVGYSCLSVCRAVSLKKWSLSHPQFLNKTTV